MKLAKVKLDRHAIRRLGLQSKGVRDLVYTEGEKRASRLAAAIGPANVATFRGGISRGRFTLRRLQSMQEETRDGLLSRTLRGG